MKYRFILLILVGLMVGLASIQVAAQDVSDPEVCFQIVDEAFTQAATSCAANELGNACYGFPQATVKMLENSSAAPDAFSEPGDRITLAEIEGVVTNSIDLNANAWGLIQINAQANLPTELIESQLGGKGLIYLVPGGIELTDATPADEALVPMRQGIAVSTIATADLRAAPVAIDEGAISNVVGRIPGETTVSADAISADQEWVRVLFEGQPGWVSAAVINPAADLSSLTVIGENSFTPMQSIMFAVSADVNTRCQTAPAGVIVQGPFGVPVDFVVEAIPVRLGSMAFVWRTAIPSPAVCFTALSGLVTLFPNDPDRMILIPPGFMSCIDIATGEVVTPGALPGTGIRPLTTAEAAILNFILNVLPENILHYIPGIIDIINPSGSGQPLPNISVSGDQGNLLEACRTGLLSETVCQILGLPSA